MIKKRVKLSPILNSSIFSNSKSQESQTHENDQECREIKDGVVGRRQDPGDHVTLALQGQDPLVGGPEGLLVGVDLEQNFFQLKNI